MNNKKISKLVELVNSLKTIEIQNLDELEKLTTISSLVILGSSATGKTGLYYSILNSEKCQDAGVMITKRLVTRPKRKNQPDETQHVTKKEFLDKAERNEIDVWWMRSMEGNRKELYGFKNAEGAKVSVYLGNNGFFRNAESVTPHELLKHALVIGTYAPDDLREERLIKKLPEVYKNNPEEIKFRLGEKGADILPYIHVKVNSYDKLDNDPFGENTKKDIIDLALGIVKIFHE
jgi:hypothetical protein